MFERTAPSQPRQVKKPVRKLFSFERVETPVQKIKSWSALQELNKR